VEKFKWKPVQDAIHASSYYIYMNYKNVYFEHCTVSSRYEKTLKLPGYRYIALGKQVNVYIY